jgi:dipeptidyl aminopeptidase/acylaminoacyl peptidase
MRTVLIILILFLLASCQPTQIKSRLTEIYGAFTPNQTLKYLPVDYTQTPINKKVQHHPEKFKFLDMVDIYQIVHLSDSLIITGFMVSPKAEGSYPCIVFNRGGNQETGRLLVGTAVEVMAPFAANGYVVIATNYRGNSGSEGKEEFGGSDVNDVINLIKSLGEYEKADTSKIGLLGISRGGMMNFLTLKQASANNLSVKCVANIGGIADLEETIKNHRPIEAVCNELIPNFTSNQTQEIEKRSVIYWSHLLPKNTPLLLLHSKTDEHVNFDQIPRLCDSLQAHKIPYKLLAYDNDNHGLQNHAVEVQQAVLSWMDQHLKQGE